MPTTIATFVGGPLAGESARRAERATWSAYRSDTGTVIATDMGDAEWHRPKRGKERRRFYALQRRSDIIRNDNDDPEIVNYVDYVHALAWDEYMARRRP